jgi:hypothetical protein
LFLSLVLVTEGGGGSALSTVLYGTTSFQSRSSLTYFLFDVILCSSGVFVVGCLSY